jgi:hypothetical protein
VEDAEAARKEAGDLRAAQGVAAHRVALLSDGHERLELLLRGADVKVRRPGPWQVVAACVDPALARHRRGLMVSLSHNRLPEPIA